MGVLGFEGFGGFGVLGFWVLDFGLGVWGLSAPRIARLLRSSSLCNFVEGIFAKWQIADKTLDPLPYNKTAQTFAHSRLCLLTSSINYFSRVWRLRVQKVGV